jgi:hypothetical protein
MSDVPCTRSLFRLRGGASGGLEGALIQESSPPTPHPPPSGDTTKVRFRLIVDD